MSEFYGLIPPGGASRFPADALAELDRRYAFGGTGRPDVPATTPYSAAQLNALPVGARYRSTDGPQGAWEWIKIGATSWRASTLDTLTRNVVSLLGASWSAGGANEFLRLRRVGPQVKCTARLQLAMASEGYLIILTPPAGFGLTGFVTRGVMRDHSTNALIPVVSAASQFALEAPSAALTVGRTYSFAVDWITDDAPATTLPGVAT